MKKPLQLASEELLRTCLLGVREIWRCFNLRREGNTFRSGKNKKQAATNVAQFGCEFRTQAHWSEAVTLTAAKNCRGSREDHHPPTRATLGNVTVANHLHEEQKRWQDKKRDPPSWVTLLAGQTFLPKSQKTLGTRLRPIRSTPSRSDNRDLTI